MNVIEIYGPPSSGKLSLVNRLFYDKFEEKSVHQQCELISLGIAGWETTVNPPYRRQKTVYPDYTEHLDIAKDQKGASSLQFIRKFDPKSISDHFMNIIVFDVQNPKSFPKIPKNWATFTNSFRYIQTLIVGTKADGFTAPAAELYPEAKRFGENLSLNLGAEFIMISSKTGEGYDVLLQYIISAHETRIDRESMRHVMCKPVIYFYHDESIAVSVELELKGKLLFSYPKPIIATGKTTNYSEHLQWDIITQPNGTLINKNNMKSYSYLFWESTKCLEYDFSCGFVVEGKNIVDFLEEKLDYLGLNRKESNDFITYWLPKLENMNYLLINFQKDNYVEAAKLKIIPKPENLIRIYMAIHPLKELITVPLQNLDDIQVKRNELRGFTVVEWGGGFE